MLKPRLTELFGLTRPIALAPLGAHHQAALRQSHRMFVATAAAAR